MNRFFKVSTWRMIINSRLLYYKNSKEDWCKERREICNSCVQNSKWYSAKTIKENILKLLYLDEPYCKICTCPIKRKTAVFEADCGMVELGEPSKWKSIINTKYNGNN